MTLDELITKCLIGEEHLNQAEYEQVGSLLTELQTLRKAYEKLSMDYNRLEQKNAKSLEELYDVKCELNFTDYALTWACEHIANENPLLFSLVGKCTISIVKEHFLRQAKMLLKVKKLTEDRKMKKIFCKHLVYTLPFPIKIDANVYFYHCLKCDRYFKEPPLLRVEQWVD